MSAKERRFLNPAGSDTRRILEDLRREDPYRLRDEDRKEQEGKEKA